MSSLIDTKHKAVLVKSLNNNMKAQNDNSNKQNTAHRFVIYNGSPESIERLREAL